MKVMTYDLKPRISVKL